jgi:hypothetical protein
LLSEVKAWRLELMPLWQEITAGEKTVDSNYLILVTSFLRKRVLIDWWDDVGMVSMLLGIS